MKRYGYLYEKICDIENIKLAIIKASKKKTKRRDVRKILNNIDYYALEIQEILIKQSYKPSPYKVTKIYDGANNKERIIHKPNFYPDQIIHWSLMLVLEPILTKGMYAHSCGSIPGKGSSWGNKYIEKWIRNDKKNTKYCLKLDIRKFYDSINHESLKVAFKQKIKDKKTLNLISAIIDSCDGLPIGNYTSQWFANFLLTKLDHHIKENLKVKYYIRYIDDMVLFGSNKKKLHKAKQEIEKLLSEMKLNIKGNWQVFRVDDRGVDFLGLRFFREKTILRKRNALRIRRRVKKVSKKQQLNSKDASAIISYWGWIKRSNSYNFYNMHIRKYIKIKQARRVISENSKHNNAYKSSRDRKKEKWNV